MGVYPQSQKQSPVDSVDTKTKRFTGKGGSVSLGTKSGDNLSALAPKGNAMRKRGKKRY